MLYILLVRSNAILKYQFCLSLFFWPNWKIVPNPNTNATFSNKIKKPQNTQKASMFDHFLVSAKANLKPPFCLRFVSDRIGNLSQIPIQPRLFQINSKSPKSLKALIFGHVLYICWSAPDGSTWLWWTICALRLVRVALYRIATSTFLLAPLLSGTA